MLGRKTKLTKELIDRFEEELSRGSYIKPTCKMLGIGESTFYRWKKEGEHARKGSLKREFWERVERSEGIAEIDLYNELRKAIKGDWRGILAVLERRFPSRWGKKEELKADLNHSGSFDILAQIQEMSEAELEKLVNEYDVDE